MTKKAGPRDEPKQGDRRSGVARRKVDLLRPGKRDRRRNLESRKPDVVELDMSGSEWAALDDDAPTPPRQ